MGLGLQQYRNVLTTSQNKLKLHVTDTHYHGRHNFPVTSFVQKS